ncbi:MAG: SLOG family protein [Clostridium chrysemydis]|uniref:SLOG family protein n=1 Tax=Clostridium chrysemydis TaxID=2665504 RepID=UPI003F3AFB09
MNICVTGHRPSNPNLGGYNWNSDKNQRIMLKLYHTVEDILKENPNEIINCIEGGALGIDQMFYRSCEVLRAKYPGKITLEMAIPFKDQPIKWFNENDIDRYYKQKELADIVTFVDELEEYHLKGIEKGVYHPAKMMKRNMYMVDKADIVIAVWDGSKGGTGNCVNYDKKMNKTIIRIDPREV